MCGIAGVVSSEVCAQDAVERMLRQISHRGPDDRGVWTNSSGVALGHVRLSILDLSAAGHQPMMSRTGKSVLVFNGEIYNFRELRSALESELGAFPWKGQSDSEVLIECLEEWGLQKTLTRLNGMYAFAYLDLREDVISFARDRAGEKPLYIGSTEGHFVFCSEIGAILDVFRKSKYVHEDAAKSMLALGFVPGHQSIARGIFRLPPATYLQMSLRETPAQNFNEDFFLSALKYYWDPDSRKVESETTLEMELLELLHDSVRIRLHSDVSVGCFLSGGIDSSLIASVMQDESAQPIDTFCIGFEDSRLDESAASARISKFLGTKHTQLTATQDDALSIVPSLHSIYSEPFADASQLPTLLLSQLTSRSVKVALSGDGGDELFGGYARYRSVIKHPILLSRMAQLHLRSIRDVLPRSSRFQKHQFLYRGERFLQRNIAETVEEKALRFISNPSGLFPFPENIKGISFHTSSTKVPALQKIMRFDQANYLPDDILVKVDRATMRYGLECRVPLLDHRIIELSRCLSERSLTFNGQGKQPLRRLLSQRVPSSLWDRPKQGFEPPIGQWLRTTLRGWAEENMAYADKSNLPGIDSKQLRSAWKLHLSRKVELGPAIWNRIVFLDWARNWQMSVA